MKRKMLLVAALAALTSVASHAATTPWGAHDNPLESELVFFGPGIVSDTFTFSLGASYDVTSKVVAGGFAPGFAFYGLFGVGADSLVGTSDDVSKGAFAVNSGAHTVSLGSGSYYYSVLGLSPAGGAYSLASSIVASPVPEPETLAMMLAGMGAVGFLARRRQA